MIKKCLGCGVTLQDKDELGLGYVKDINSQTFCMRCFRLKNYHELSSIKPNLNNDKLIEYVNNSNYKVYFLIDILNLNEETINSFKRISRPKTLVISKMDILLNESNVSIVTKNIMNSYNILEDIIILSSVNSYNIKNLNERILNEELDVIIMGYSNSGKSSLIKKITGNTNLLVSESFNTTLDIIKLPLENKFIYDTPGLEYSMAVKEYLVKNKLGSIDNKIDPKVYQIKPASGIKFLDFSIFNNSLEVVNITLYLSNGILITKYFKKEDNYLKSFNFKEEDLVIKGVGFLRIKNGSDILVNGKENLLELRKTILGGSNDKN